jgi:hypothetical protein
MTDKKNEAPKRGRGRPADPPDKGLSPLDDIPQFEFVPRDLTEEAKAVKDTKAKALKARNAPLKGQ